MDWEALVERRGRRVEVLGSTMHVIDTGGTGPTAVFLHGNPTSAYLWRHVIERLSGQLRCVAIDLIGMGRSGKPDIAYDWPDHRAHLHAVLDLVASEEPVWVVGHDWGAGLGIEYARTHADRVAGVAFLEGHLRPLASWDTFDEGGRELFQQLRDPQIGRRIVEDGFFLTTVLPSGIRRTLSPEELQPYLDPFPTPASQFPIWRWVTQIPIGGEPAEVAAVVGANLAWLQATSVPRLLLWATPGAVVDPAAAATLAAEVPGLDTVHVGDGLHFLPEDQPDAIADALRSWIGARTQGGDAYAE